MLARRSERLTEELIKIGAWSRRAPQADQETVGRRIGRHPGKYPAVAAIVVTDVKRGAGGRAVGLRVSSRLDAGQMRTGKRARISCAPTERSPIRSCCGSGISGLRRPRRRSAPPRVTGARGRSFTKKDRVQARIVVGFLALALWRSPSNECRRRDWAPARVNWNWSRKWRRTKAWT